MSLIYKPKGPAGEYAHLAINHYQGCTNRCIYCYVPTFLPNCTREQFSADVKPKPNILSRLGREIRRYRGTNNRMLLCFACDPYPDIDASLMLTRDVVRILRKNDVPFQILTKAGLLPSRDFDLYRPGLDAFAVTLTTVDSGLAAELEPGAGLPTERIELLKEAHYRGIETWVSLEPVIEPMESLKVISATCRYVDLFKIGRINHAISSVTPDQWRDFTRRAMDLCTAGGSKYYIKQSLAIYLGEAVNDIQNTDNRCALLGEKRMDQEKTIRCVICQAEFTDSEIANANCCPNCADKGVPILIKDDVEIKINWHELRILSCWAERWAQIIDSQEEGKTAVVTLDCIAQRLEKQFPDKTPLTIRGEVGQLKRRMPESNFKLTDQEGNEIDT